MSSKFIEISLSFSELTPQKVVLMLVCANAIYGMFVHWVTYPSFEKEHASTFIIVNLFLYRISISLYVKIIHCFLYVVARAAHLFKEPMSLSLFFKNPFMNLSLPLTVYIDEEFCTGISVFIPVIMIILSFCPCQN